MDDVSPEAPAAAGMTVAASTAGAADNISTAEAAPAAPASTPTIWPRVFMRPHHLGRDRRQVGHPFLEGRQDLDPLDGIDAQVRLDVHIERNHLHRVAGQVAHHRQEGLIDPARVCGGFVFRGACRPRFNRG